MVHSGQSQGALIVSFEFSIPAKLANLNVDLNVIYVICGLLQHFVKPKEFLKVPSYKPG